MPKTIKERSLLILKLLTKNTRKYTAVELAKELGVTRRTVYRYLDALVKSGFIVRTDHHDIRLVQETEFNKGLSQLMVFNANEAALMYQAIDSIEINATLRNDLKKKLTALFGTQDDNPFSARSARYKVPRLLSKAIKERKQVIFQGYSSPNSNTAKDRHVEPFKMSDDGNYVWAYELESSKNKVFRVSRIQGVKILRSVWCESRFHMAGYTDAFQIISFDGTTIPVRMRMNRRAYNLLVEEYPLTEKDITYDEAADQWIYDSRVSNLKGIGRFVLGLCDCIKIESPELRSHVRNYANRYILGNE